MTIGQISDTREINMRAHKITLSSTTLTPHLQVKLFQLVKQMKEAKLSDEFIASAIRTALEYEGVADLIVLWAKETDPKERNEIIADIQELIDDCSIQEKVELTNIKFNDLDVIAKNIRQFKDNLLTIVDRQGGLKRLTQLTGIPQPSLSRFFNTDAMPRRATLLKIAKALGLKEIKITQDWFS